MGIPLGRLRRARASARLASPLVRLGVEARVAPVDGMPGSWLLLRSLATGVERPIVQARPDNAPPGRTDEPAGTLAARWLAFFAREAAQLEVAHGLPAWIAQRRAEGGRLPPGVTWAAAYWQVSRRVERWRELFPGEAYARFLALSGRPLPVLRNLTPSSFLARHRVTVAVVTEEDAPRGIVSGALLRGETIVRVPHAAGIHVGDGWNDGAVVAALGLRLRSVAGAALEGYLAAFPPADEQTARESRHRYDALALLEAEIRRELGPAALADLLRVA